MLDVTQRCSTRFVQQTRPLFPGYMFVSFDPEIIKWTKINSTYGVSKILTLSNNPAEISSDLVLELKNRYEININPKQNEKLQKGDAIKFYTGPFCDLIAKVESMDENNRIWVLLEAMGGRQRLKLQSVEKNKYNKF